MISFSFHTNLKDCKLTQLAQIQCRGAVLPVVGWPPVRSFRRNLTNASSSKQSPEQQNDEACDKAKQTCKRSPLIKINMDGIPIGRKINLSAYDNYQKLSSAVEDLFCGFLEGTNHKYKRSTWSFLYNQILCAYV